MQISLIVYYKIVHVNEKIQEAHKNKRKHANAQFVSISCQKVNNITIHLLINYPSFFPHLPRLKDKS